MTTQAKNFTLENISETSEAIAIRDQLQSLRKFLEQNDAPEQLLGTVYFLLEDNEQWICSDIERALLSGRLARDTSEG